MATKVVFGGVDHFAFVPVELRASIAMLNNVTNYNVLLLRYWVLSRPFKSYGPCSLPPRFLQAFRFFISPLFLFFLSTFFHRCRSLLSITIWPLDPHNLPPLPPPLHLLIT